MQGKRNARLQYLLQDADTSLAQVVDESIIAQMMAKNGDISNYDDTTDSLEALSIAVAGGSTANVPQFIGTVYYVDGSQSDDSGDGLSPTNAKKTIGAAITAASAGDAITIKAGTYAEDVVIDKASMQLWPESGVILAGTGTCLTISGAYCRVGRLGDIIHVTPAADQIGVSITGAGACLYRLNVVGSAAATGFDIDGAGVEMHYCRASGIKAGGKAFDIGAPQPKLYNCSTTGATTSYGFYMGGATLSKGLLVDCTSAGNEASGFYLDANVSEVTVLNCSSGASDGRWGDVNNANVWSNFSYADQVYKEIDFTDNSTAFNLFKVTGIVEIESIFSHVEDALNAEFGNCKLEVVAGSNTTDLTDTVSLNNLPAGSFIGKTSNASVALTTGTSASPQVIENTNYRNPNVSSIIVAEEGATTYIRLLSSDSAGTKDGKIHWHCIWKPIDENGFVGAA